MADLGESSVDDRIGNLIANSSNPTVGVLAHPGQVDVRIAAKAANVQAAQTLIAPLEVQVRGLLGEHVFATDDQTMEDVVGELLQQREPTIAVCEDLSAGMAAERLQRTAQEQFVQGIICNGTPSLRRTLSAADNGPGLIDRLLEDDDALTEGLAQAIRICSETSLGLAVHLVPGEDQQRENLGQGRTYIAVADGSTVRKRVYNYAGRGLPDRTRISLNALDLVRRALMQGR